MAEWRKTELGRRRFQREIYRLGRLRSWVTTSKPAKGQRSSSGPFRAHAAMRRRESRPLHITSGDATSLKQTCRNPDQRWCRQIVPDSNAQLCERHIAAFVAMATVRGYPQLVWSQVSPVMLPVNTEQCAGFSLPATRPPGIKPPQHCASPGCPGLPLILLCSPVSA